MIIAIAADHPGVLVIVTVVITIVVALARSRDDAPGADCSDGEKQAADHYSCCVFHGVSYSV
jgi:hypothetical protein